MKEYPAKLRLVTLQCLFSCIQTAVWAVAVNRNPSVWKIEFGLPLLSMAYCVCYPNPNSKSLLNLKFLSKFIKRIIKTHVNIGNYGNWAHILVTSMGNREERASIHCTLYSFSSHHYLHSLIFPF